MYTYIPKPEVGKTFEKEKSDQGSRNIRVEKKFEPETPFTEKRIDLLKKTQRDKDRPETRFPDISLPHPGTFPPRRLP